MHRNLPWIHGLFTFKEEFVYEDLLSGAQVPKTLAWNPENKVKIRESAKYSHLIENYDQVVTWMDELCIPGMIQ
jgi:hypothetical protein